MSGERQGSSLRRGAGVASAALFAWVFVGTLACVGATLVWVVGAGVDGVPAWLHAPLAMLSAAIGIVFLTMKGFLTMLGLGAWLAKVLGKDDGQ